MRARFPRRFIALAVTLVAVGACSSSDDSTAPSTTLTAVASTSAAPETTAAPTTESAPATTEATPPPTTEPPATTEPAPATTTESTTTTNAATTEPDEGADAELIALAESALINGSLFPDGWTETPPVEEEESEQDEEFSRRVDECLGIEESDESDILEAREAKSGEFEREGDAPASVEHRVTVADDEAMALRAMERAATDGADACLEETLQAFFATDPDFQPGDGIELGDLTVTRVDTDAPADERIAYRIELPLTFEQQAFVQYLEVLYQRQGRALSQLQFASFAVPFDEDGHAALSDEVDVRLAAIGG